MIVIRSFSCSYSDHFPPAKYLPFWISPSDQVLYQMFRKFIAIGESNLQCMDYLAGIGSFVVIALGGVLIGLLFAVLACIATK